MTQLKKLVTDNSILRQYLLLFCILLLAASFRFLNLNWDQGQHLHPDERFLVMVGDAMKMPSSLIEYLDPTKSPFNPANVGYSFYVYGTLPLVLNKLLAVFLGNDSYDGLTIQGRALSGIFDLLIVFLVFKTTQLFEQKYALPPHTKYLAAFFYAVAVLPIQLSHFFAVDIFLSFFLFTAVYGMLRFCLQKSYVAFLISSCCFGLALSSKINAVFVVPLLGYLFLYGLYKTYWQHKKSVIIAVTRSSLLILSFIFIAYITLRIGSPYLFKNTSFFNPEINVTFIENLKSLKMWEGKDVWYPPAIQWIQKPPVIFSVANLALLGVGIPFFLFLIAGGGVLIREKKKTILFVVLLWNIAFFLYQSTQFVKALRYFIFLYPFFAIFAAYGFITFTRKLQLPVKMILICLVMVWPLTFLSIYLKPHSRVTASRWIYQHIPSGSLFATEHWDDPLPLLLPVNTTKQFTAEQLPIFDPDTPEKWLKMNDILNRADYYIMSSNRGWGSIPTVPEKYPLMTKFYHDLFAERTNFKKIAEFTSYPSLFGFPLPDDVADETFTVYDHPKVLIYQRQK